MDQIASAAYVAELQGQIAGLSERCAVLAAELASTRHAAAEHVARLERELEDARREFEEFRGALPLAAPVGLPGEAFNATLRKAS